MAYIYCRNDRKYPGVGAGKRSVGRTKGGIMRKKCFTFTELCIVVTLTAVIAALVIPAALRAQGEAKKSSCLDNIRSCLKATIAYADEHQGVALLKYGDGGPGKLLAAMVAGRQVGFGGRAAKRLDVREIVCPDITAVPKVFTWHFTEFYAVPYMLHNKNYSLNYYEVPEGFANVRKWPNADVLVNFRKLRYPDSAVIYAEAYNKKTGRAHSTYSLLEKENAKLDFRHAGKCDMAFADGHAEGKPTAFVTEQREASGIGGRWFVFDGRRESVGL